MDDPRIVGFILIVIGGFQAVRPDLMLAFQKWVYRRLMGAQFEWSGRTKNVVRSIGAAIMIMGLLVVTQAIP